MSLTTFGDLLTEAEAVLTDLAARRSLDAAGMVAGWQLFARRAVHAITAATGDGIRGGMPWTGSRSRWLGRCRSACAARPPPP